MKLKQIIEILNAEILVGPVPPDLDIKLACGADLLSDVLAFAKADSILLTGLTHSQVIRTAEIAEIRAVCFVRGKSPATETLDLAGKSDIPVLRTALTMYESCGRLYNQGLPGYSKVKED